MKTIEEIAGETGIDRTVLFRAYKIGKLPGRQSKPGSTVLLDEASPEYADWLVSHFHATRTIGAIGGMERVAQIAAQHKLCAHTGNVRRDTARPLVCIFRAIEQSPEDLNDAFAVATGEVMRLTDTSSATASLYVEAFREEVLGAICHGNLSTLWQREKLLVAAYTTYVNEFLRVSEIGAKTS